MAAAPILDAAHNSVASPRLLPLQSGGDGSLLLFPRAAPTGGPSQLRPLPRKACHHPHPASPTTQSPSDAAGVAAPVGGSPCHLPSVAAHRHRLCTAAVSTADGMSDAKDDCLQPHVDKPLTALSRGDVQLSGIELLIPRLKLPTRLPSLPCSPTEHAHGSPPRGLLCSHVAKGQKC
eukprot:GGOE01029117.1.p2 GENE.GGOE01029117.1~~GGOE01029117.1.p2  ORF type:complete len:187 (-),score=35.83 GGOE01029117.1:1225-1755(-)